MTLMQSNVSKNYNLRTHKNLKKGWGILLSSLFLFSIACQSPPKESVTNLPNQDVLEDKLDAWHLAAAEADSAEYFDFMTSESRFLGTDASENWSKDQFLSFSSPYFQKGKAWSFSGFGRNWYYSQDSTLAWFDERLNTWMGECRGSGVMLMENEEVKLAHYNLSVTIENDKIQDFIALSKNAKD